MTYRNLFLVSSSKASRITSMDQDDKCKRFIKALSAETLSAKFAKRFFNSMLRGWSRPLVMTELAYKLYEDLKGDAKVELERAIQVLQPNYMEPIKGVSFSPYQQRNWRPKPPPLPWDLKKNVTFASVVETKQYLINSPASFFSEDSGCRTKHANNTQVSDNRDFTEKTRHQRRRRDKHQRKQRDKQRRNCRRPHAHRRPRQPNHGRRPWRPYPNPHLILHKPRRLLPRKPIKTLDIDGGVNHTQVPISVIGNHMSCRICL